MKTFSHTFALSLFAGIFISTSTYGMFSGRAARILSSCGGAVASAVLADYMISSRAAGEGKSRGYFDWMKGSKTKFSFENDPYTVVFEVTYNPMHVKLSEDEKDLFK